MSLQTPIARTKEKPPEQMLKEPAGRRDYLLAFLAACGMLAPALYIVTWIVAGLLYPGYNQLTQSTSELTSKAAPPAAAAVANFGGYALGLLVIAFAFGLYRGVRPQSVASDWCHPGRPLRADLCHPALLSDGSRCR